MVSKKSFTVLVAKRYKTVFRICLNNFCGRLQNCVPTISHKIYWDFLKKVVMVKGKTHTDRVPLLKTSVSDLCFKNMFNERNIYVESFHVLIMIMQHLYLDNYCSLKMFTLRDEKYTYRAQEMRPCDWIIEI